MPGKAAGYSDTGPEPTKGQPSLKGSTLVGEMWKGLSWGWSIHSESEKTAQGYVLLSSSFCYPSFNDLRDPKGLSEQRWLLGPSCQLCKNIS